MNEKRISFPGGFECFYLNSKEETRLSYSEIFLLKSFKKHGIELKSGDCVFDIGAGIGLFSLFAGQLSNNVAIYSYEPSPTAFQVLEKNLKLHGAKNVRPFQLALGSTGKQSLSQIIKEHKIEVIDLLRMDASGAELDILEGVAAEDWAKVKQVMIEVDEMNNRVKRITELLNKYHFDVTSRKFLETEDEGATYNIYAKKVDNIALLGKRLRVLEKI